MKKVIGFMLILMFLISNFSFAEIKNSNQSQILRSGTEYSYRQMNVTTTKNLSYSSLLTLRGHLLARSGSSVSTILSLASLIPTKLPGVSVAANVLTLAMGLEESAAKDGIISIDTYLLSYGKNYTYTVTTITKNAYEVYVASGLPGKLVSSRIIDCKVSKAFR